MIFEDALGKSKAPLAFIPFINGISSKDFDNDINSDNLSYGADAKVPIGNSLNM
jgi:hypothetical protein